MPAPRVQTFVSCGILSVDLMGLPVPVPAVDRWLMSRLLEAFEPLSFPLILNGHEYRPARPETVSAAVKIRDRWTMAGLLLDPEVAFGDGYSEGRIEVDGDLVGLLEAVLRTMRDRGTRNWFSRTLSRWLDLWQANTRSGSLRNIHKHYDLGTDFFQLWLDRQLLYTCAYFPAPSLTLEEAQEAKMDYVCRKLQLQRGETVVEAGCGWGALAIHMARHYGVRVRAFNISHEQIVFARRRAAEEGLDSQVEFIEEDYRNISGPCDVFVSVGMVEHVGASHYRELGNVIYRAIGRSGRGLLHFIGRNRHAALSSWIRKVIFPGAYPPPLHEAMEIVEPYDYAVLDVENLRLHYARTLEFWLERFERSQDQVAAMFDPQFARAWRLYLAGSLAAFRVGTLQLFQMVFAGPDSRFHPWTRAHLYTGQREPEQRSTWISAMP